MERPGELPQASMATSDDPSLDFGELIRALDRHRVKYPRCGGAAATAYGAERPTEDADCVVRRERAKLDHRAQAMRELIRPATVRSGKRWLSPSCDRGLRPRRVGGSTRRHCALLESCRRGFPLPSPPARH